MTKIKANTTEHSTELTALTHVSQDGSADRQVPSLVVAWSAEAPERIGELLSVPTLEGACFWLGRGTARPEHVDTRLDFFRQRPGETSRTGWQLGPRVSRRQLVLRPRGQSTLEVQNVGRRRLLVNGEPTERATIALGDTVELSEELLLYFSLRPLELPRAASLQPEAIAPFGQADKDGLVGESPILWQTREHIASVAKRPGHVLILGESGTGKELAAQAVHRLSAWGQRPMIARNAATFPPGLIDAELFGNTKDYPNVGLPARPGLIGAADGSSLFLDEIGELPHELQNHLLRVLDGGGEYQRLGESHVRTAKLRLIAATNRPLSELKADLAARLPLRLVMPGLNERREDIPLLVRHLLARAAAEDPTLKARFFEDRGAAPAAPRVAIGLMRELLRHHYRLHVRELSALLWTSVGSSTGDHLELTEQVKAALRPNPSDPTEPAVLCPKAIQECLDRHHGVQEKVWRELGMKNRYVLKRLIKKHGLRAATDA